MLAAVAVASDGMQYTMDDKYHAFSNRAVPGLDYS